MYLYFASMAPLAVFGLILAVRIQIRKKDDSKWKPASSDRLLRPAGESLRLKIDEFNEQIEEAFGGLLIYTLMPIVFCMLAIVAFAEPIRTFVVILFSLTGVLMVVRELRKFIPLAEKRRRYKRGFDGERLVGEHLNEMLLEGYRVFHDIPFDNFNVDHVVVGPAGVYAIETKTRRKRKDLKDSHKVTFDGFKLKWPDGRQNDYGIDNAVDRARSLQKWLSSAVGTPISVKPVLVFPGWMVNTEKLGKVRILNPKTVKSYILGEERKSMPITEQCFKQIVHQLSERVRLPDE